MTFELYQDETDARLQQFRADPTWEPAMFDGFLRGAGKSAMAGVARGLRSASMLGSVVPIALDKATGGGTELQDVWFKEVHEGVFQPAVEDWTPKPGEAGIAGQMTGALLSMLPQIMVAPGLLIGGMQVSSAEDLVRMGVDPTTANIVGAGMGIGLGLGIRVPMFGQTAFQRVVIGGMGFNVLQGAAMRAVGELALKDTPGEGIYRTLDWPEISFDLLLGAMFGGWAQLSRGQRAEGARFWQRNILGKDPDAAPDVTTGAGRVAPEPDEPTIAAAQAAMAEINALNPQLGGRLRVEVIDDATMAGLPVNVEEGLTGTTVAAHGGASIKIAKRSPITAIAEELRHMVDFLLGGYQVSKWIDEVPDMGKRVLAFLKARKKLKDLAPGARFTDGREMAQALLDQYFRNPDEVARALPDMYEFLTKMGADKYRAVLNKLTSAPAEVGGSARDPGDAVDADTKAAVMVMRRAQHTALDSTPGRPLTPEDASAHADRLAQATEQLARGEPVDVENMTPEPQFEHIPEKAAEQQAILESLVRSAEEVRVDEGLPPVPPVRDLVGPEPLPPGALDTTRIRDLRRGEQPAELGRMVEERLTEIGVEPREASANAAIWESFFDTAAKRYGVDAAEIVEAYGIDIRRLQAGDTLPGALAQAMGETRPALSDIALELRKLSLQSQRDAGWNPAWPFIPADLLNTDFRRLLASDPELSSAEKKQIFDAGRMLGVVVERPTDDPRILFQGEVRGPTFYSELARQVEALPAQRVPTEGLSAKQWKALLVEPESKRQVAIRDAQNRPTAETKEVVSPSRALLPGVKLEEIKWSGIEEWLELQDGKVPKEAVQAYLEQNGVRVTEKLLGGPEQRTATDLAIDADVRLLREHGFEVDQDPGATVEMGDARWGVVDTNPEGGGNIYNDPGDVGADYQPGEIPGGEPTIAAIDRVLQHLNYRTDQAGFADVQHGDSLYQTPGGTGYRELLLTLPTNRTQYDARTLTVEDRTGGWLIQSPDGRHTTRINYSAADNEAGARRHAAAMFNLSENATPERLERRMDELAGRGQQLEEQAADARERGEITALDEIYRQIGNNNVQMRLAQRDALAGSFVGGHYGQTAPGVLAHIRFKEHADTNGKRILFIEEIQSDWAQVGRRERFKGQGPTPEEGARIAEQVAELDKQISVLDQRMLARVDQTVLEPSALKELRVEHQRLFDQSIALQDQLRGWIPTELPPSYRVDEIKLDDDSGFGAVRYIVLDPIGRQAELSGERYAKTPEEATRQALKGLQERGRRDRRQGVPRAPFVENSQSWAGLTLKRMIRWAAENGYDKIAWTTGEQQVDRYTGALRKHVDAIDWEKTPEGVHLLGYKGETKEGYSASDRPEGVQLREEIHSVGRQMNELLGGRTVAQLSEAERVTLDALHDRQDALTEQWHRAGKKRVKVVDTKYKETELSDAIGKAMAKRILEDPNPKGSIEGENIKIDDTGMAGFYDRMLPNIAKGILKKLDAGRVTMGEVELGMREGHRVLEPAGRLEELRPMVEHDWDAFAGAESWDRAGDIPMPGDPDPTGPWIAEGFIVTRMLEGVEPRDPQNTEAVIIADANGISVVESDFIGREWHADSEDFGHPNWTRNQAREILQDMWNNPRHGAWSALNMASDTERVPNLSQQPTIEITPQLREKALRGLPLFQEDNRGQISMRGGKTIIGLFERADRSTFLHESGHFFLEATRGLATAEGAPAAAAADWGVLANWLDIEGGEISRAAHEKFAKALERYVAEGKAPTPKLQGVFAAFRDWLLEIYRSIRNIGGELSDDVRGVMGRMLGAAELDAIRTEGRPARTPSEGGSPPPPPASPEGGRGSARPEAIPILGREGAPPARETDFVDANLENLPAGAADLPLTDTGLQAELRAMADDEAGWAQVGGKRRGTKPGGTVDFTEWIARAEWWRNRPGPTKLTEAQTKRAVTKLIAGEKLTANEQKLLAYMAETANDRLAGQEVLGRDAWREAAEDIRTYGLEPSLENVIDADAVARASAIDAARVEDAAMRYQDDDQGFMAEIRNLIDENENAEAPGRGQGDGIPETEPGAEPDPLRSAAYQFATNNPEAAIEISRTPEGEAQTMNIREYLDQARADTAQADADAHLFEIAAACMLGR